MEKVILTKEQHEALSGGFIDFETCIRNKIRGFENDRNKCLNELSTKDFASALINGYEIEETPEEKIINKYNFYVDKREKSFGIKLFSDDFNYSKGWLDGCIFVLDNSDIKIKGVNC